MSATEPLSPLDATFLELEEADVTAHMHIEGCWSSIRSRAAAHRRSRSSDGTSSAASTSCPATVFFCVQADRDAAPDAHRVVEGIQAELDALGLVAERAAAVAAREAALARQAARG